MLRSIPLAYTFAAMKAKGENEDMDALWRAYMANVITLWGDKDTKTWAEVLEAAMEAGRDKSEDVREAYDVAENVLRQLEKSRKT